ncbi:MAG: hypothetical protein NVS3B5_24130 [Sphingomicrobium sp.]
MHLNKIAYIKTLSIVAQELGEDEDWLHELSGEMEPEDGVIWVLGVGEHGIPAFSDYGIESLRDLIEVHRENEKLNSPRPLP